VKESLHPTHPTDTQLLNHSMGLPIEETLSRHIVGCRACRHRLEQLAAERVALGRQLNARQRLAEHLDRRHAAGSPRRPAILRWLPVTGALLILTVGLVFVFLDHSSTSRLKGAVGVQVYVKRDGQVLRADNTFRYRSSDRIRLGVLAPRPVRITVLALQPKGYSAVTGLENILVPAGEEKILPGSLSLDCGQGTETLRLRVRDTASDVPARIRNLVMRCEKP